MESQELRNVAVIRTSAEEDKIKKFVLQSMENLAFLMKSITSNVLKFRIDYENITEFKSELISLYFYYARPKIPIVLAPMSQEVKEQKAYDEIYDLDYYTVNPQALTLQNAFYYAQKIRELFEDLGIFRLEQVEIGKPK